MSRLVLRGCAVALTWGVAAAVLPSYAGTPLSQLEPVAGTPHILDVDGDGPDGVVTSVTAVGDAIVLGGDFSVARNDGSNTDLPRSDLMSFDKNTKQVSPLSLPINGIIKSVVPAGGTKVYISGDFTLDADSLERKHLALIDLAGNAGAGAVDATFAPVLNGKVNDVVLTGGRLWAGGNFNVEGATRNGLVPLSPATGERDVAYSNVFANGTHGGGITTVKKLAVAGSRLFVIGNFNSMGGEVRDQFAVLDLGASKATLAPYATNFFATDCPVVEIDSYMRDIDVSPDGSFLVIVTSGGHSTETGPCDAAARFETGVSGGDVHPSWIASTGGDTLTAVEVTDSAVYVGGHFQFINNPFAGTDIFGASIPGPAAVARKALAALEPTNGLPFDWNPTRDRGLGVFDFLVTPDGLWVGSDTEKIGPSEAVRQRIALLPAGGLPVSVPTAAGVPGNVYMTGAYGQVKNPRVLYRVDAGGAAIAPTDAIGWAADSNAAPSPQRVKGPTVKKRKPLKVRAGNVPATTPASMFVTSRLGTAKKPGQAWNFKVAKGQKIFVQLYFAKPCKCKGIGKWAQSIKIEGKTRGKKLNLAKAAGKKKGIMRRIAVTPKDGNLDIDLVALKGRTSLAGVEIVTAAAAAPITAELVRRGVNAGAAFSGLQGAPIAGGWSALRGAFWLDGQLYTGWQDGRFLRAPFNGSSMGATTEVNGQDALVPLGEWKTDVSRATSLFYDSGRIYFTRSDAPDLYYRYFNASSGVVGATRYTAAVASPALSFNSVRGAFLIGSTFYWSVNDGALRSAPWLRVGPVGVPGTSAAKVVSGTGVDSHYWWASTLFLAP